MLVSQLACSISLVVSGRRLPWLTFEQLELQTTFGPCLYQQT